MALGVSGRWPVSVVIVRSKDLLQQLQRTLARVSWVSG